MQGGQGRGPRGPETEVHWLVGEGVGGDEVIFAAESREGFLVYRLGHEEHVDVQTVVRWLEAMGSPERI